ncbi:MAG: tail fiber domain-containing protein [Pseudomonadota bacterium]
MKHIISFLGMAALLFAATFAYAAPPPNTLTYQGVMYLDDVLYDGQGDFKLVITDSSGVSLWSNDLTSVDGGEPTGSITKTLNQGVFSIILGDTTIQGMAAFDPIIFDTAETVYLKVWFDGGYGFSEFTPPMRITSVVYALNAGNAQFLEGYPANAFFLNTGQITRTQISDSAVGAAQIEDDSVTPEKITAFSNNDTTFTVGRCQNENINLRACTSGAANQPGIRFNSTTTKWQYSEDGTTWNNMSAGGGSGTVNAGTQNQMTYYAADGDAVSGLATANNGVLVTSAAGVPSISSTLPGAVQSNITGVGTIGAGVWQGTAVADAFVADNLTISGGTISNSPIDNSVIGSVIAAAGTFTDVTADNVTADFNVTARTALILEDPGVVGTNTITFAAPDPLDSSSSYVLPGTPGSDGQVLTTDGINPNATLSWTDKTDTTGLIHADGSVPFSAAQSHGENNITNVGSIALDSILADDGSSFSIGSNWTNAGNTIANLGSVTTVDINGGTIDNVRIGDAVPQVATFTDATADHLRANAWLALQDPIGGAGLITIDAPDGVASYILQMPSDDGDANQVMTTDGSGILSWTDKGSAPVDSVFGRTGAVTAAVNDYTWAQVDKTTSSLADITTRSAGDLSSGNLTVARMPTGGDWTLTSDLNINGTATVDSLVADTANIDGGTIDGATINETIIGNTSASTGTFTDATADNLRANTTLVLEDPAIGTNTITFDVPDGLINSYALQLPGTVGANGQVLTTDGNSPNATLSWTDKTSVSGVIYADGSVAFTGDQSHGDRNITNVGDIALDSISADGASFSMGSNWTNAGRTVADGGTFSTIDINGGTMDNVRIGDAVPQVATFTDLVSTIDTSVHGGDVYIGQGDVAYAGRVVLHDADALDSFTTTIVSAGDVNADQTYTLPASVGSVDQVLTIADASGVLGWTDKGGGGAATTALDNLASVAINAALLPGADDTIDLGSGTNEFKDLYIDGTANIDSLVADTADINAGTIDNTRIGVTTPESGTFTTARANTSLVIEDPGAGSEIVTITALDGLATGYDLVLPPDDGEENQVLATDGVGNLSWETPAAAGANTALSNLASVAVNTALIPDGDGTRDLGAHPDYKWNNLYIARNISDGINSTNIASIVTLTGTQDLLNKTLTSPTMTSPRIMTLPTAVGATWGDLGSVTTVDVNGGTIDGATIGAASATTGRFTTLQTTAHGAITVNPYDVNPGNTGETRWRELAANGTNYMGFKAPDLITDAGQQVWTLPSDDGADGEVLYTNGAGILSWKTVAGTVWTEETSPADFLRAKAGGLATSSAVLYGTGANTHVNWGFGINPTTGTNLQNYSYITLSGGYTNNATYTYSTVGGGAYNTASNNASTVSGGYTNTASGSRSTVSGGVTGTASGDYSTVGGGSNNIASGVSAVIGGGQNNAAIGSSSTVAGGNSNSVSGLYSTVGGGFTNTASALNATVAGGNQNTASGAGASVGGGNLNSATAQGSRVSGGTSNSTSGDWSWVGGRDVRLDGNADRSFVWGYSTGTLDIGVPDVFLIFPVDDATEDTAGRLGVGTINPATTLHVNSNTTAVAVATIEDDDAICTLNPTVGASWSCSSDERLKTNIVDLESALEDVLALRPVRFNVISTGEEHIGFIAQEVQKVMPQAVDDSGEYLTLAQGMFMPLVVGAIQEQQKQIEELMEMNEALRQIVCLDHPEADVCIR